MEFWDLHEKLMVTLAAGNAPDLAMVEIQRIGPIVNKAGDLLQDLNRAPFNAERYKDDFVPYKWRQATNKGRLVAMPWDVAPAGLFYRRSIFEEKGFDAAPEILFQTLMTWDDYIAAGKKITVDKNGDDIPEQWMIGDAREIARFAIEQVGIPVVDEENVVHIAEDPFVEALEIGRRARTENVDGITAVQYKWSEQWSSSFGARQAATELMGSWFEGTLKDYAPESSGDWGIIPTPGGPNQVNQGGSFIAMSGSSKHKEAAWKLIEFLLVDVDSQNHYLENFGTFPAYMPAWNDSIYDEPNPFFGGQVSRRMFLRIAQAIPPVFIHPLQQEIANVIHDTEVNGWSGYITKAVNGDIAPRSAFNEAARQIQAVVDEWLAEKGM